MRSWPRSRGCSTIPTPDVAWGRPDAGASKRSFRGRAWPSGPSASTATPSTISRRPRASRGVVLAGLRGFVFDLDGCVWQGERLNPGAADTLAALHHAGRGVAYLTNNSRARGADVAAKLRRLGVTPTEPALTPLEILGDVVRERGGRWRPGRHAEHRSAPAARGRRFPAGLRRDRAGGVHGGRRPAGRRRQAGAAAVPHGVEPTAVRSGRGGDGGRQRDVRRGRRPGRGDAHRPLRAGGRAGGRGGGRRRRRRALVRRAGATRRRRTVA